MTNPLSSDSQDNRRSSILKKYRNNPHEICNWLNEHGWPAKIEGKIVRCQNVARNEKKPSIDIDPSKGAVLWIDRGNSSYRGDLFHLAGLVMGIDPRTQFPALLDALDGGNGYTPMPFRPRTPPEPPPPPPEPLKPFPPGREPPRQRDETARWHYRNADSLMIMSVIRTETPEERRNGEKKCKPWIWDGTQFVNKGAPKPRPLFNLDRVAANPTAPVLVVEGEKCAQVAQEMLQDWVVTTWPMGSDNAKHADWAPLKNRNVWVWPDADDPGHKAARQIADCLSGVRLINVKDMPKGWDIADAIADGWDQDRILDWIANYEILEQESHPFIEKEVDQGIYGYPDLSFTKTGEPRIQGTSTNLAYLLQKHGMKLRRNLMTREIELNGDSDGDRVYQGIVDACLREGFPDRHINSAMAKLAKDEDYHPFKEWVLSKPWDGVDRIGDYLGTIEVETGFEKLKVLYLCKFLLSIVTAAFTTEPFLCKAILTFQGAQSEGKTSWFEALMPQGTFLDGTMVNFENKDDKLKILSHLVAELGELEATFKKSAIAAIKAFTGSRYDYIRRPYGRAGERMERRTVLVASVNQERFLNDPTGNVRFWVLPVTATHHNILREIDRQQLFAQVYQESYGDNWWLSKDEMKLQAEVEERFRTLDPVQEAIADAFHWEFPSRPLEMGAMEVLRWAGIRNPSHAEVTRASTILTKVFNCEQKKTKYRNLYKLPTKVYPQDNG